MRITAAVTPAKGAAFELAPLELDEPRAGAFFGQSAFATYALATERNVVKVDPSAPPEFLGPLGCGIQTGAGGVLNSLRPPVGSSIAVFGTGSVGMSAVMASVVAGCTTIIAVDLSQKRLDLAQALVAPRFPSRSRDGGGYGAAHPAMIYLIRGVDVIFIAVKFPVRAERSADWMDLVDDFTQATRREPGNLFFEWSRSVEDPNEFVLVEAFRDGEAGREHVQSAHFKEAIEAMSYAVAETPKIVSIEVPGREGWDLMGEITPRDA